MSISTCGVCHTELDDIEGRTPPLRLLVILGHLVVGQVEANGLGASQFQVGERVGITCIYSACGQCAHCLASDKNLCADFRATERDANGGYAEFMTISESFAYPIPQMFSDAEAAPLLCAGAIGYCSLRLAGLQDGQKLGLTGFGASAYIVFMLARYIYPNSPVYVFSRNEKERAFACQLGAVWAGAITDRAPQPLDRIIDTTPVWLLVPSLFIVPVNGGQPIRVAFSEVYEDSAPSWSPDGNWIVFESHAGQDEDTPSSVWCISVQEDICASTN